MSTNIKLTKKQLKRIANIWLASIVNNQLNSADYVWNEDDFLPEEDMILIGKYLKDHLDKFTIKNNINRYRYSLERIIGDVLNENK